MTKIRTPDSSSDTKNVRYDDNKKKKKGRRRKRKDSAEISFLRQFDIFDPDKYSEPITIVGCGGIGSALATTLAKLGIKELNLIDDDLVMPHNIPNQTYFAEDAGKPKVKALADHIERLGSHANIYQGLLEENESVIRDSSVICSGLDSMFPRSNLWDIIKEKTDCVYFDGRLGGQKVVLYSVDLSKKNNKKAYELTLHPEDEAEELPCTERIIIDISFLVGATITRAVRKYLKDKEMEFAQFIDWDDLSIYRIPSASDYIKTMKG